MKTFKVLYIDDDKDEALKITPLVRELSSQGFINIELEYPGKLESFVDYLANKYRDIDAIMIDLRLNENHKDKEDYATYPAQILANAIRTYQNGENKKFEEFPLFLISSLEKKAAYYDSDVKSHDLFDFFVSKNDIPQIGTLYEKQIYSITNAYQKIKDEKNIWKLLSTEQEYYDSLNVSFETEDKLISSISQFIFNEVILRNGILINEDVLAARLGIDYRNSKDWKALKEIINPKLKYEGIFGDIWSRWWSDKLIQWWEEEISSEIILINSEATQRVELLREKLNLTDLNIAKPIEQYMSQSFWTVCKALNQPLDIYDGLLLNSKNENWQDKEYVSATGVIEGHSKRLGFKLHPNERDRYEEVKLIYKQRKYGAK